MGVGVRVGGNDVARRAVGGEDAELAVGLIAAQQDREGVGEELRVLALSLAEEVGLRLAGQQPRPGGSGPGRPGIRSSCRSPPVPSRCDASCQPAHPRGRVRVGMASTPYGIMITAH